MKRVPMKERTSCPKCGADLRVPGAMEDSGSGRLRCVSCRRTQDRERHRRSNSVRCPNGHLRTADNTRLKQVGDRTYRTCIICHRQGNAHRYALLKRRAAMTSTAPARFNDQTADRILALVELRDRQSTHWDRDAIMRQIEQLQPRGKTHANP